MRRAWGGVDLGLVAGVGDRKLRAEGAEGNSACVLVALTPDAQLLIAKPTATGLGEIRRYEVADSATWAHPVVLSDGFLIKDLKSLTRWSVN